MTENEKKKWVQPQIKVLVKSSVEETVLETCKTKDEKSGPGGPPCWAGSHNRCEKNEYIS